MGNERRGGRGALACQLKEKPSSGLTAPERLGTSLREVGRGRGRVSHGAWGWGLLRSLRGAAGGKGGRRESRGAPDVADARDDDEAVAEVLLDREGLPAGFGVAAGGL